MLGKQQLKTSLMGRRVFHIYSSAGEGACCQAWQTEFNSQLMVEEGTPENCPLTPLPMLEMTCVHLSLCTQ